MKIRDTRQYHLQELQLALEANSAGETLPPVGSRRRVLDIGCGAGQTLIGTNPSGFCVGVDSDFNALKLGTELSSRIHFIAAQGEVLPFRTASFDMVFSRVALPYMHIASALSEVKRVLEPSGQLWLTLHDIGFPLRQFRRGNWKGKLFSLYVLANGISLHCGCGTFGYFKGQHESFQTRRGIYNALTRAGFRNIQSSKGQQWVVTALA